MEILPRFEVLRPGSVAAAIDFRETHANARFVAGGTDLMVNLRHGLGEPDALIDLRHIPELRGISVTADGMKIGCAVTLAELGGQEGICTDYPALVAAALSVGAPAHREAATIGGNLCLDTRCQFYNRSEWFREANEFCLKYRGETCHVAPTGKRCHAAFSGDLAPALLVYGAEIELVGRGGRRRIPLGDLYAEDGAAHLRIAADELLACIYLPRDPWPAAYAKARARGAIDFPLAGVAVALRGEGSRVDGLRVAMTGTNARPFLLSGTSALESMAIDGTWRDRLAKLVQKQVSPMRTTLLDGQYRRRVASALATRLACQLAGVSVEQGSKA